MPVLKAKYNGEWINVSGGGSGGGPSVQSDWNQNDSTQLDYVKNRTHYDAGSPVEFPVFSGESMIFTEGMTIDNAAVVYIYEMQENDVFDLTVGNTYHVTIDGETYIVECRDMNGDAYLGSLSVAISIYPNTGEPFFIFPANGMFFLNIPGETHDISIIEVKSVVEKELIANDTYTFSVMSTGMLPTLINIGGFDLSTISKGDLCNVTFDGITYTNTVIDSDGALLFGNLGLIPGGEDENTGEPYLGLYSEGMSGMYALTTTVQHQFSIDKALEDSSYTNIVPDGLYEFTYGEGGYIMMASADSGFTLEADINYKVSWGGTEYTCTSIRQNFGTEEEPNIAIYIGNLSKIGMSDVDSGEPFIFGYAAAEGFMGMFIPNESFTDTHQIKVSGYVSGVKKLDKKYLPDNFDVPVASQNKIGGVKVYDTTSSDLLNDSNYSKIYLSTNDNTIYAYKPTMSNLTFTGSTSATYNGSSAVNVHIPTVPTSLKNPYALTFTGGATGTYDGSSAKTVAIPTALKNPYPLTFSGAVSGSYNGSSSKTIEIPIVPTSLKNPNALTFTGLIEGSYDGSEAVTIEIPTGVPKVTTDNNGQILQVVDGTWVNNNPVFNYTTYIDQGNGYKYHVYMYNGELVIQVECVGIEVVTMPTTIEYFSGQNFDPTGMIVNVVYADGNTKEISDFVYSANLTVENPTVTISYTEFGITCTTTFDVTVYGTDTEFIDFTYTINEDNSITLNTWKGTLNGSTSTECVIPDGNGIIDVII